MFRKYIQLFLLLSAFGLPIHSVFPASGILDSYKIRWEGQSANSSGSMPCGGGDVGMNVWTENNEILFYLSRSNTFDENNALLKLGRIRISFEPELSEWDQVEQVLDPQTGIVTISIGNTKVSVRADVFQPIVNISCTSTFPVEMKVTYENWRLQDFIPSRQEFRSNSYKFPRKEYDVQTRKDSVRFEENTVCFFHHNRADIPDVFDISVRHQGLESLKDSLHNPLRHRIFGGVMAGNGFVRDTLTEGTYQHASYRGWRLRSSKRRKKHEVNLFLHTMQTPDLSVWKQELGELMSQSESRRRNSLQQSAKWWLEFWNRSYIAIEGDPMAAEWQVGRNYQLFRFMLGCNAFGEYPTKFNGGLFTFDPVFVKEDTPGTPDFRYWGGGTMTAQNQRLVYWPFLKNGDTDLMIPQFEFYLRSLRTAELRSEYYWNHKGACFTEQIENFGLPNIAEYGYGKPDRYDKGMEYNKWLEYQWETVLEFCLMILEADRYRSADLGRYLPLIESCMVFFDEHYRMLAALRGAAIWTDQDKYVFYPSSAAETYKMAYNSTTLICGLKAVGEALIGLDERYVVDRSRWSEMLRRLPDIPVGEKDGQKFLLPAETWARVQNSEAPQLYPVFPYRFYGVNKPDLQTAVNTYFDDPQVVKYRTHEGWRQHPIFAACLGLTDEASTLVLKKMADGQYRFPAFRGPGMDWTPDHNWLGAGSIALQEMLMQCDGDQILLAPAWPDTWNVTFKLHAPQQTLLEGRIEGGKLLSLKVTPEHRRKDIVYIPAQ